MPTLNRQILLQTLDGYAEANRISENERRARLMQLSEEQARYQFDDLNQGIRQVAEEEKKRLQAFRLEHHINVRQAFEKLAIRRGYESTF